MPFLIKKIILVSESKCTIPSTSRDQPYICIGKTKKGGELLSRAGYEYCLKRINKDGSKLWRCVKKYSKCNATIKTIGDPMMVLNETAHCHEPNNPEEDEVKHQMQLCLESVKKDLNVPVTQIFEENIQILKEKGLHLVTKLPIFENVSKRLYKKRNEIKETHFVAC